MGLYKLNRGPKPLHINQSLHGVRSPSVHGHRHRGVNKRERIKAFIHVLHLPNPPQAV